MSHGESIPGRSSLLLWVRGRLGSEAQTEDGFDLVKRGTGRGGATKKRRGQGRRVAVTEHRSNGVSRVATLTKHPSTTHGGSTRRQQGQHGDKNGRGWAEETLLLLLVLHGTCLGQSPSQVGRNDEDSSHHEMMQCPAPATPSFSPDPLGRHRPGVCSCAQELLDSH